MHLNDRKNALAMARSRYVDFYRADFLLALFSEEEIGSAISQLRKAGIEQVQIVKNYE